MSGEDLIAYGIIDNLFGQGKFSFERKGVVVDIGAWHPYHLSNSFLFYLLGWHCINVDANKDLIPLFEKFRPRDKFINACVSDKRETVMYHRFKESACNTVMGNTEELLAGNDQGSYGFMSAEKMETLEINALLEKTVDGRPIDFLSLDIEGMDEAVFRALDFKRFSPLIIAAEIGIERWTQPDFQSFIESKGYRVQSHAVHTLIMTKID